MRTLFFCNTNYQLITAIQITKSLKKNASVVVTNEIKNVDEICERLAWENIFEMVLTIDVKSKLSSSTILKRCVSGWLPDNLKGKRFDEFVGFNLDIPSHFIYAGLFNENKDISVNKMEEGLLSYNTLETTCSVLSLSWKVRKLLGKANLREVAEGFYCFQPQAYTGTLNQIRIPKIDAASDIKDSLARIFTPNGISSYSEKYVFLSCVYDFEGGEPIGELELAKLICEKVGNENLIVKVHPRDDTNRYKNAGLKVDTNSKVPFEVIELCADFKDKVLITTLSGSLLNFNPVLENPIRSIYGYKLCNLANNHLAQHYSGVLTGYLDNRAIGLRNIEVARSMEDIVE